MKKIYITLFLVFLNIAFGQTQKLPFIGTKNFSFSFGNCCEHSITISKNGNCIIKGGISVNNKVLYSGKYSNLIWLYDKKKRKTNMARWQEKNGFIMGNQIQKCRTENCKLRIKNYHPG